jgi:hypothetical protein
MINFSTVNFSPQLSDIEVSQIQKIVKNGFGKIYATKLDYMFPPLLHAISLYSLPWVISIFEFLQALCGTGKSKMINSS